ncbi:MAG TPA: SAM-dependent methyltransferase [Caldilineaceae bacterium]|nr:SAM-dependent methyltransferase [Caldilineaceae bacterium]
MSGEADPLAAAESSTRELILTADPDFVELALDELRAADPGAEVTGELAPGVLLVGSRRDFATLAGRWQESPPIFVRHICPVQVAAPLAGQMADLETLAHYAGAELASSLNPSLSFSVQARVFGDLPYKPYDIHQRLAPLLAEISGAALDVRAPQQVVSVVCAGRERTAYLGLSAAAHNLSNWAGGMRRFAREEGQISRAEFKLLEAIEVFGLSLPPRGVALDLGAAPGGWTRVLRLHQQYVTAVDPGDLDPRLAQDRGVRHKRMTAEAYLADEPDQFDIIVNDMRMDARDSARLMVAYARQLYRHGWALMTLKLPEQKRRTALDHAMNILRQGYTIAGARHLFHNRSEITVYLRPLPRARVHAEP